MDTLFFILSKLVWGLLKPETWLLLAFAAIFLLLWRGAHRAAFGVTAAALVATAAIGLLPIGAWWVSRIEARYPPAPPLERVDGIIVLGGGERQPVHGQPQFNEGGERFTEAHALALRFPQARVFFVGGSGILQDVGKVPGLAARTADLYFRGAGLEPERLLFEPASRNTAENAAFSLEIAQPEPGETWVLVTSAFHMPRAMRSFERAGWTGLVAWPVDFRGLSESAPGWSFYDNVSWRLAEKLAVLNIVAKESVGSLVYDLTGR